MKTHQQQFVHISWTCVDASTKCDFGVSHMPIPKHNFAFSNPNQIVQKAHWKTIVIPFYSHILSLSKSQHEEPNLSRISEVRETSMPSFESENAQEAKWINSEFHDI